MKAAHSAESTHYPIEGFNPALVSAPAKEEAKNISPFDMLVKYRPYIVSVTQNKEDAEDLEQDVNLKLFKLFGKSPEVWERIKNKSAYMFTTIRNSATDTHRSSDPINYVSYDDDRNLALKSDPNFSDKGKFAFELETDSDLLKFHQENLQCLMVDFSDYERDIIIHNVCEGIKPRRVADFIGHKYPEKNARVMASDCNAVKAKLRARLKKQIETLNIKSSTDSENRNDNTNEQI